MDLTTATLLVNGIISMMNALPGIISSIQKMDAPEETKEALLKRIQAAQDKLPVWE